MEAHDDWQHLITVHVPWAGVVSVHIHVGFGGGGGWLPIGDQNLQYFVFTMMLKCATSGNYTDVLQLVTLMLVHVLALWLNAR